MLVEDLQVQLVRPPVEVRARPRRLDGRGRDYRVLAFTAVVRHGGLSSRGSIRRVVALLRAAEPSERLRLSLEMVEYQPLVELSRHDTDPSTLRWQTVRAEML